MNGPIVPVIVIDDAEHAVPLAEALKAGGIHCAEITLRTGAAFDAIAALASMADFTVGVGTVTSIADLEQAVDAGARFAVSPGLDESIFRRAGERGIPLVPGVGTATEAQHAVRMGARRVKLFPADQVGGLQMIRALSTVFPTLTFMPSGGVSASNARAYLDEACVWAVSGSWMAPRTAIRDGRFDEVTRVSLAATELAGGYGR